MQSFDQSLMNWLRKGKISYENALFYSSNPSEFALRVSGIEGTSDRTFAEEMPEAPRGGGDRLPEGLSH
jgi:Tfp pilus assembly ATPase PilU